MKFVKANWPQIVFLLLLIFAIATYPDWDCAKQEKLADPVPAVNPLTAELKRERAIIDNLVSFNNLLIRELEACEDGRTPEED